ncbi:MAG: hypothetical protein JW993_15430 [Sedimentisphaerales bacterium]|nr:hypothetical protein [Sedimentisphaerales bacterium]
MRPSLEPVARLQTSAESALLLGPYRVTGEVSPGTWIVAVDPVLRRRVWLLRRGASEPSQARRDVARPGRLRWLQKVETADLTWDAFEAMDGVPFRSLVTGGKRVSWSSLRYWLEDLASELWEARGDGTGPDELSLDHVWIAAEGRAVLLDEPWPSVEPGAESMPVGDIAGQQRFLSTVAAGAESTTLPLHARAVLRNLEQGRFQKLSFLTGTLRGLLDRPAEVSRAIRAGSVFMLPVYIWILTYVGCYQDEWMRRQSDSPGGLALVLLFVVLGIIAVIQLPEWLFRGTASGAIFRLAVVNAKRLADRPTLLKRWVIVWLPLFVPVGLIAWLTGGAMSDAGLVGAAIVLALWLTAVVHAVMHPHRGLHDRLVGTWVVRR